MIAADCPNSAVVFAYDAPTDNGKTRSDGKEAYELATKSRPTKKLVIVGGLHGMNASGVPCGMSQLEKHDLIAPNGLEWANLNIVNVGGVKISSFATKDTAIKGMQGEINFIYKNIGRYATDGSTMTPERQAEVLEIIKGYRDSKNYIVLLAWCYSRAWAISNGL